MGLVAFIVICIASVLIGWVGIWILGNLAPGHPVIIDTLIWVAVVVVIGITLLRALGILDHDIQIPRL